MNYLFMVHLKENDWVEVPVYAVRDDKTGFPHFLIYNNGRWKYESAKHFIPMEEWYCEK